MMRQDPGDGRRTPRRAARRLAAIALGCGAMLMLSGCYVGPAPGYYRPPPAGVYVAPRPYGYGHYGYGYRGYGYGYRRPYYGYVR